MHQAEMPDNVRFKGHSRTVCPQHGNALCYPSGTENLEVGTGFMENLEICGSV